MPYSHITWAALKGQLAARLGDTGKIFTPDVELGLLLGEALRTWGSITSCWKERGTLQTAAATAFYDICATLDSGGSKILSQTITDRDLIKELQYALLESAVSQSAWNGTEMFALDDLAQAIQRRRNQLLVETGIILTNRQVNVPAPPLGRVPLPESVIDVRWAAWKNADGDYSRLQRSDEFAFNSFRSGWSVNPGTPEEYSSISASPATFLQLAPHTNDSGQLDMVSVDSGSPLSPETAATVLGIPDDIVWVVKWGALADLLGRAGIAQDSLRARYCEMRWQQGVEIARMQSPILQAEINGVPLHVSSLPDVEQFRVPYWREASGQPDSIGVCGYNMVALADVPDAIYSITMDVVRKAAVPTTDAEPVQICREELNVIVDYAEHLGVFKQGGSTFTETMPLLRNFYRLASIHNQRMRANATFFEALGDRAIRPKEQHPRRSPRETQSIQEVNQ